MFQLEPARVGCYSTESFPSWCDQLIPSSETNEYGASSPAFAQKLRRRKRRLLHGM